MTTYRDNYPHNIESPQKLYIQYSHDISFDYSTGKYPDGTESDWHWESNYIPITHKINGLNVGRHEWMRIRVGEPNFWSYPIRMSANITNISTIESEIDESTGEFDFVIKITFEDGSTKESDPITIKNGKDGTEIVSSEVNGDGYLIITYNDGRVENAGKVKGEDASSIPITGPDNNILSISTNIPVWITPLQVLNLAFVASEPLSYDFNTGIISLPQGTTITNGYISSTDWTTFNNKQDLLVSGTNIKTVNSQSLLGSGDILITGGEDKTYQSLTSATTVTMDTNVSVNGKLTLAHNVTLTLDNLNNGDEGNIEIIQGSIDYTLVIIPTPTITNGGVNIELLSGEGSITVISYTYDGTNLLVTYNKLQEPIVFASQVEAEAGTDETKSMNSLRVLQSFVYQIANKVLTGLTTTATTIQGAINELVTSLLGKQIHHGFYTLSASPSFTGDVYSIPATAYSVAIGGVKYDISSIKSIDIGALAEYTGYTFAQKQGQWFIWMYISGGVPVLGASKTGWDILDETKIPVDTVYANDAGSSTIEWIIGKEKHGAKRNLLMHKMEHDTDGARWVSGLNTLTVGSGVAGNSTNTFSLAGGIIRDEDLYHTISNPQTQCRIGYKNGSTNAIKFDTAGTAYCKLNAGVPQWDNSGTLTDLSVSKYMNIWQFATNRIATPIVHILGQGEFTSVAAAQAAPMPQLYGFSVAEWKVVNRIIIRNIGGALNWIQTDPLYLSTTALAVSGSGLSQLPASNVIVSPISGYTSTNQQGLDEELDSALKVEYIPMACSDVATAQTAGVNKANFAFNFSFELLGVFGRLDTVCTGSTFIIDINNGSNSFLSTKLSIDASEATSLTAATPAVINATYKDYTSGERITIDFDQVGATIAGAGVGVILRVRRTAI